MEKSVAKGKVYLVGAGPGDPGLITVKACKILKECDVVIYDALINSDILQYAPPTAEKIFVGLPHTEGRMNQAEIERIMVQRALEGHYVVRLKGGDPFIFGRGGEEAETLTKAGINWEVVPGVPSGVAAPAYAAIPLTHRCCSSSVTFLTGHESVNKSKIEWNKIRHAFNTLVIFMGVSNMQAIIDRLLESNYEKDTPVAIIESGTTPEQRVRTGTIGNISQKVSSDPVQTPALIVIGEVVKYRETIIKNFVQDNNERTYIDENLISASQV